MGLGTCHGPHTDSALTCDPLGQNGDTFAGKTAKNNWSKHCNGRMHDRYD